jgi:hypothetical protein
MSHRFSPYPTRWTRPLNGSKRLIPCNYRRTIAFTPRWWSKNPMFTFMESSNLGKPRWREWMKW